MRRALVAANWKMNASVRAIESFAAAWREPPGSADILFCPPLGYLDRLAAALPAGRHRYGVQNVATAASGAFTGEHAPEMAADLGATHAIVGHSERRALYGETDALAAEKFAAARRAGLTPILCVGETLAERRAGQARAVVLRQVDAVLAREGAAAMAGALVAYEPVWAIGTGETAAPEAAAAVHEIIRARVGRETRLLYGGSVKADNAPALFAQANIDGALVGGASLDPLEFAAICAAAGRQDDTTR